MARKIEVEIVGDSSSYQRALGQAQGKTSKFGAIAKTALIGGAAAGMYALGKAAKIGWDEFNQGERGAAQTAAAIKSTGGVANVTAKNVQDLAQAMLYKTGIDDDAAVASENMLLTFTKVRNEVGKGNDIFNQATTAVADMATRMNNGAIPSLEQMSSTSITVGKALNNPISGLTRLQRVGVEFTDRQKEMITRLEETGHHMEAQKIILGELTKEFGGSAKAAGQTFGGQLTKLQNIFDNFLGMLVGKAIPYIQRLIKWIGPNVREAIAAARKAWNDLGDVLDRHRETVKRVQTALGFLIKVLGVLIKWEILLYSTIARVWLKILDVTMTVTEKIIGFVGDVMDKLKAFWEATQKARDIAKAAFNAMLGPIRGVIGVVQTLVGWIQDAIGFFTDLLGLSNNNVGSGIGAAAGGTGRGGSGGGTRPTGLAPRATSLAPRLAASGGGQAVAVYLDGDVLWRGMARAESRRARR